LGHIYKDKKNYAKAEELYRKSIELNPTLGGKEALEGLYKLRDERTEKN
jgi:tetratricopeptide (TPR) repeat protein